MIWDRDEASEMIITKPRQDDYDTPEISCHLTWPCSWHNHPPTLHCRITGVYIHLNGDFEEMDMHFHVNKAPTNDVIVCLLVNKNTVFHLFTNHIFCFYFFLWTSLSAFNQKWPKYDPIVSLGTRKCYFDPLLVAGTDEIFISFVWLVSSNGGLRWFHCSVRHLGKSRRSLSGCFRAKVKKAKLKIKGGSLFEWFSKNA